MWENGKGLWRGKLFSYFLLRTINNENQKNSKNCFKNGLRTRFQIELSKSPPRQKSGKMKVCSSLLVVFHNDFFLTDEIDFALQDCHINNVVHSFFMGTYHRNNQTEALLLSVEI